MNTGLRSQIIFTLTVLILSALILATSVLLASTRDILVEQKIALTRPLVTSFATDITNKFENAGVFPKVLSVPAQPAGLEGLRWQVFDQQLHKVAGNDERLAFPQQLSSLRFLREPLVEVESSKLLPFFRSGEIVFFVPLLSSGRFVGLVDVHVELNDVRRYLLTAGGLSLFLILFFGLLITSVGYYLLGKIILQPLQPLLIATRKIAAGKLVGPEIQRSGARELTSLSEAFSTMVCQLKTSQQQSTAQIDQLQNINQELVQTQQELLRTERMASVGHLAAGMAHEIGNPLGAITGYLNLLADGISDSDLSELVERIQDQTQRIDILVRELLDYAGSRQSQGRCDNPENTLQETIQMLEHQGLFKDHSFNCRIGSSLSAPAMTAERLQQLVVNLLINARDATAVGGGIALKANDYEGGLLLEVVDEGEGIDPQVLPAIFDPFFTTKPLGQGRGLGLSVCQHIVTDAQGTIDVHSTPGKGCCMRIFLPAAPNVPSG